MSEFASRVASALRNDDEAELKKLRNEQRAMRGEDAVKADLDARELVSFKKNHGWIPPAGADID